MRSFVVTVAAAGFGLLALSASQDATASAPPENMKAFVVFFENNQVALTPEGREIVKAAAENARRAHAQMITVAAPTTRVVAGYDPAMAAPRLALVRQALIASGVRRVAVAQAAASDDVQVPLVGAERVEIRVVTRARQQNT